MAASYVMLEMQLRWWLGTPARAGAGEAWRKCGSSKETESYIPGVR